ncbi:flavin reductase family protein, partial [Methylobacterium hispanicum]
MDYDFQNRTLPHNPLKAIVAPRPIGWISTMDRDGRLNLAPYSFFNAVADDMVAFSSSGRKDAMTFAEEGGDFVCNLASHGLREAMNDSSAPLPRGESEFAHTGLATAPSRKVRAPRVA